MLVKRNRVVLIPTVAVVCALMLVAPRGALLFAQQPPSYPPRGQTLTPDQVDDLVAPIALYPDPLLSQISVAATYPLEIVQAEQRLQRNPDLTGPALTHAAQQQNGDPSVQAPMMIPDLIKRLTQPVTQNIAIAGRDDYPNDPATMMLGDDPADTLGDDEHQRDTDATHGDSSNDADTDRPRDERSSHEREQNRDNDRDDE